MKEILNSINNNDGLHHNIKKDLVNVVKLIENLSDNEFSKKDELLSKLDDLNEIKRIELIAKSKIAQFEGGTDLSEVLYFASFEANTKINILNETITKIVDNELGNFINEINPNIDFYIKCEDCEHFVVLEKETYFFGDNIFLLKEHLEEFKNNSLNIER